MAAAGNILRVALHYGMVNAGDIMNVFHFRLAGAIPSNDAIADAVADWVTTEWGPAWAELAGAGCELVYGDYDIINLDGTVAENIGSTLFGIPGVVGGDLSPAQAATYILAHTAIPKARGSKYLPGVPEAIVTAGELNVGGLANLALALAVYLAPYTAGSGVALVPGVLSLTLAQFVPFITSGLIDTLTATQRRRKAGVGI